MADEKKVPDQKKTEKKAADKKPNVFQRIGKFCKEMISEIQKVVWPSAKQVTRNTGVVICFLIVCGLFIGLVDAGVKLVINFILGV